MEIETTENAESISAMFWNHAKGNFATATKLFTLAIRETWWAIKAVRWLI